ncbi:MAG: hypothetical protein P1U61_01015 [Legionellaceae bacterium]|nr:hypothetical protein [Legionellaceae bacterium]
MPNDKSSDTPNENSGEPSTANKRIDAHKAWEKFRKEAENLIEKSVQGYNRWDKGRNFDEHDDTKKEDSNGPRP